MAGLANFALSPTDTQSVSTGASAAGARSNAPKFRISDQGSAVFDAVLNTRQSAAENRNFRDPVSASDRNAQTTRAKAAVSDRSPPGPDRPDPIERRTRPDAPGSIDRTKPDRQATASDGSRPQGAEKSTPSDPVRSKTTRTEDAGDPGETKAVEDADEGTELDVSGVGEDGQIAEILEMDLQIDPAVAQAQAGPQETSIAGDEAGLDSEAPDTTLVSPSGDTKPQDTDIDSGAELADGGEPENLLAQTGAQEAQAAEGAIPVEAQDKIIANAGALAKDAGAEAGARPAAPAGEAAANPAKKGAGAVVPDADGAPPATDAEAGDDALAPKPRTAETGAADRSAKTDGPSPRPAAAFAAELGAALRPNPPPGQTVQGAATPLQADGGAAIFRASTPAAQGAGPNLPVRAIALHIINKAVTGATKFQIRLDPPELGRIDVKLEIARDGRTQVQLTVDRPETLEALLRDQRGLERTLQNAGLDTTKDGLSFNLRQDAEAGAGGNDGETNGAPRPDGEPADTSGNPVTEAPTHFIGLTAIDIRV